MKYIKYDQLYIFSIFLICSTVFEATPRARSDPETKILFSSSSDKFAILYWIYPSLLDISSISANFKSAIFLPLNYSSTS